MNEPALKIDGRTKEGRAARAAAQPQTMSIDPEEDVIGVAPPQREAPRQTARAPARQPARQPARAEGAVMGRNGEILTRTQTHEGDPFEIPAQYDDPGWERQWIAHTVVNSSDECMRHKLNMEANGWRPVLAKQMPGVFMPMAYSGHIINQGQGLYERPKILSDRAREEDIAKARRQMSDRDESLMGGKAAVRGAMKNGFAMDKRYRGTGGDLRMSIDRALDIPAPQHQLAEPGE